MVLNQRFAWLLHNIFEEKEKKYFLKKFIGAHFRVHEMRVRHVSFEAERDPKCASPYCSSTDTSAVVLTSSHTPVRSVSWVTQCCGRKMLPKLWFFRFRSFMAEAPSPVLPLLICHPFKCQRAAACCLLGCACVFHLKLIITRQALGGAL